jgi:hypothetical protein
MGQGGVASLCWVDGVAPAQLIQVKYFRTRAGILGQSMGARNRVGIGLSYRTARLHRLAETLESIPWLLKSLKIPSPSQRKRIILVH